MLYNYKLPSVCIEILLAILISANQKFQISKQFLRSQHFVIVNISKNLTSNFGLLYHYRSKLYSLNVQVYALCRYHKFGRSKMLVKTIIIMSLFFIFLAIRIQFFNCLQFQQDNASLPCLDYYFTYLMLNLKNQSIMCNNIRYYLTTPKKICNICDSNEFIYLNIVDLCNLGKANIIEKSYTYI